MSRHRAGTLTRRGAFVAAAGALATAAAARTGTAFARPPGGWFGLGASSAWPMPAHDLSATRFGTPLAGDTVRWSASFPGGVPATAAIDEGYVFAASGAGAVAALELTSGTVLWEEQFGTAEYGSGANTRQLGFFAGVALAEGGVIVASDRARCLDARTGATRWTAAPLRTSTSDDYFWGLPAVVGDLVLIGSGSGAETPTARGRLTAYRISDGTLVWSTPMVPLGANGGGIIGPASVDPLSGVVYVATGAPYVAVSGSNPGTCSLIALSLRTGSVLWADQVFADNTTGFDFNSAPVIIGRLLVATNKAGVYAWDRFSRRRLWNQQLTNPLPGAATSAGPTDGPEGGPIATDGQRIYVLSNDSVTGGAVAAALAPSNGAVLWTTPLPAPSFAAPALAGETLCVPGADGSLRVLDAASGSVAATIALGNPSSAAPSVSGGSLLVGTGAAPYLPGDTLVCIG